MVHLVACARCHTQYDVSNGPRGSFRCRCGALVIIVPLAPLTRPIARCGSCGGPLADKAIQCSYCRGVVEREARDLSLVCPECFAQNPTHSRFCRGCGVGFRPEQIQGGEVKPICPCCGHGLLSRPLGQFPVLACARCQGLWISHAHFESIVNSVQSRFADDRAAHSPPANSGWNAVVYRKCPECSAFMHRKNFEQISGIILDECRVHGRWLDVHELEAVARFVSAGGLRRAAERAKEQAERAKEQAVMERATAHVSNLLLEPEGPRALDFLLERLGKIFTP